MGFREGLMSMHLVHSHTLWGVRRFVDIAENSWNITPYDQRGWCFFESTVASVGAGALQTVTNGRLDNTLKSPVPLTPEQFSERMEQMVFASPTADRAMVCDLYRRIFPTIAKTTQLKVFGWGDEDAQ